MRDRILQVLAGGPLSGRRLQQSLGVSQPTVSRLLRQHADVIARIGSGRSTVYSARRAIAGLPADAPVYRISERGEAREIGVVSPIHPGFAWHDRESGQWDTFGSLPWFLDDMRPQGFLGRAFPRLHPDLGLPERVQDWSEDQALYAHARRGEDWVGNLVIGEESFQRWVAHRAISVPQDARNDRYPRLAEQALAGELAGSTPGGEQAKFAVVVGDSHRVVKFSERLSTPIGRRRADLLVCEHLALEAMARAGLPAARSFAFESADRFYLEVERFDRVGARGRRGVISLGAADDQFVGQRGSWLATAIELEHLHRLSHEDVERIGWLQSFGGFIANNDMHFGNLSLFHEGGPRFDLAPAYDMLPMFYAPARGEVPEPEFTPPAPPARAVAQAREAQLVAIEYWRAVAEDVRISPGFRALVSRNAERVAAVSF